MIEKTRLDIYLTEKGMTASRERAKAQIMAGVVFINNQKADKAGILVSDGDIVEVRGNELPYVSRGGLKLEKAIKAFDINLKDKICMDIGASTGGFTDCMLQNGAVKVYSVDVGYGQLAWSLRTDSRVVNLERTNIRYVTNEQVPDVLDFGSVDVSFISLKLVLPVLFSLLSENGSGICLIKPQFEAGKENVGKKGVVRDIEIHRKVIYNVVEFTKKIGFFVKGLAYSPVKGPQGNIEFLMLIKKSGGNSDIDIESVTASAHAELD